VQQKDGGQRDDGHAHGHGDEPASTGHAEAGMVATTMLRP
jgi:hypothetical protein